MSGKKPKNMQESFPEVVAALKSEIVPNVKVKARFANKTREPNSETFQICQVLQDCKCPHRVTIVKETFVKCEKNPPDNCESNNVPPIPQCPDTELKSSMSYTYCKEIIQPFLEPNGKSPDELACEAVSVAACEFPMFEYCCMVEKKPEPIILNSSLLKNPPPTSTNTCSPQKPPASSSISDAGSCVVGAVCGATCSLASKAKSCMNKIFCKKECDKGSKKR